MVKHIVPVIWCIEETLPNSPCGIETESLRIVIWALIAFWVLTHYSMLAYS